MTRVCVAFAVVAVVLPTGRVTAADPPEVEVKRLAQELEAARKEIAALRKENEKLAEIVKQATADREKAILVAQVAAAKAAITKKKLEALLAELNSEETPPDRFRLDRPLFKLDKVLVPLPDSIRGTVTEFKDGTIRLSIGADAGLTEGAVLDVYRTEGGGDYLGTVVIQKVLPKGAVGAFKSKDGRPLNRLRPEQLPKAGDAVGKIGAGKFKIEP